MSEIIKFEPKKLTLVPKRSKVCFHPRLVVVESKRLLKCKSCGAFIDPFDFVFRWACRDYALEMDRKRLQDDCRRLSEELKDLKRQEKNIKARIKRANQSVEFDRAKPCGPTCQDHVTHPCENCGRQWG